jgi:hypothetical protein
MAASRKMLKAWAHCSSRFLSRRVGAVSLLILVLLLNVSSREDSEGDEVLGLEPELEDRGGGASTTEK